MRVLASWRAGMGWKRFFSSLFSCNGYTGTTTVDRSVLVASWGYAATIFLVLFSGLICVLA
jgi:hypothetical protein